MIKLKPSEGSSSYRIDPGVWVRKVKILEVKDFSNYPTRPDLPVVELGEKKTKPELCLGVKFIDGEYEKKKQLWAYWAKDKDTKQPLGWSTFKNPVLLFLVACIKAEELEFNDDWTIPKPMLMKCEATDILMIQYQTNKWMESKSSEWKGYSKDYWKFTFSIDTDKNVIKEAWEEDLKWTKDYARDIALAKEAEAKENKTESEIQKNDSFTSDDDDLPF